MSVDRTYIAWIKQYILFLHKRHPKDIGVPEIEASRSVTDLTVAQRVAASTPNQDLNALLLFRREVLKKDLERPTDALCAKR